MNELVFSDIEFGNKFHEVTKKEFYERKNGIKLKDVIADKIVVSNKVSKEIMKL